MVRPLTVPPAKTIVPSLLTISEEPMPPEEITKVPPLLTPSPRPVPPVETIRVPLLATSLEAAPPRRDHQGPGAADDRAAYRAAGGDDLVAAEAHHRAIGNTPGRDSWPPLLTVSREPVPPEETISVPPELIAPEDVTPPLRTVTVPPLTTSSPDEIAPDTVKEVETTVMIVPKLKLL